MDGKTPFYFQVADNKKQVRGNNECCGKYIYRNEPLRVFDSLVEYRFGKVRQKYRVNNDIHNKYQ